MKTFATLLPALLLCLALSGQEKPPKYFLNEKPIQTTDITYLSPKNIDSIHISKDTPPGADYYGEVHIFTKGHKLTFLTLDDIRYLYAHLHPWDYGRILYRINGKLITDTTGVRIDSKWFVYVTTDSLSGVKYLAPGFCNLLIVNIELSAEERKPEIMIRGGKTDLPFNTK